MIKKYVAYSLLSGFIIAGFSACDGAGKKADKEEIHNAATQTIPKEAEGLIGRWDITVDKEGKQVPSWLEVKLSGFNVLVGAFVADAGSSRPVSHIKLDNGKFSFEIPPQWEGGEGVFTIQGELVGEEIKGTITSNKGNVFNFSGVKAPYLVREGEVQWGEPIELFNGKDLTGWKTSSEDNQWVVKDGILINQKAGANLITEQKFEDFKLTAEFRYAEKGNSGIYLRGRYEVQIEDSPKDRHPGALYYGGVYGFLAPSEMVTNGPNEWNTYEITLRGRMVTIVSNGKTIINNQEIPGITGGALDSKEGEPGPIYLQGDHTGVEFRKISITPAK
ncbi:3-keto-disaccharide hydrolase [Sphingobacterium paucimobilis]|uniref:3-keto-alpha-glucoside-1,2-lyase/3-keto-2-hydroxy-glucal hydratase domain-containing protein n=1 Tax=Sphingobacterium paucimobilis HER1398 TaxID=1346330 RepID=U2JC39_9SPHI|nr:DUF1080 domain-containing protein [Sphingobacterium paucimobilis]ERJ60228.1 hypothetical protein M472_15830 [Sphingobacterium paucimobilis HER1398]